MNSNSRSKRAVLGIIGEISKSIFGTATTKDVKLLAKHISHLEDIQGQNEEILSHLGDELSSFITISTERHNSLVELIAENHDVIKSLSAQATALMQSLRSNREFYCYLIKEVYYAMILQTSASNFVQDIDDLLQHKSSMHIIPYDNIRNAMAHINEKLTDQHTRLTILPMTSKDLYTSIPFFWIYRNNALYISLKFPLILDSVWMI